MKERVNGGQKNNQNKNRSMGFKLKGNLDNDWDPMGLLTDRKDYLGKNRLLKLLFKSRFLVFLIKN